MRTHPSRRSSKHSNPHTAVLFLATALLLLAPVRMSAQLLCGGETQPACSSGNPYDVYYNQGPYNPNHPVQTLPPFFFTDNSCDLGLRPNANNRCMGNSPAHPLLRAQGGYRHILGKSGNPLGSWVDFAMKQQRYGVQSDQAMNWITIFGTHNSFSNYQDGAFDVVLPDLKTINFNVDQYWSIYDQLEAGARYIRVDPLSYSVDHFGDSDPELRVCHESGKTASDKQNECEFTSFGRLFSYALAEIREWLKLNPEEVLVMRLNRVPDDDIGLVDQALNFELEQQGIGLLKPNEVAPTVSGWPTLREMRAMNKRMIVFISDPNALGVPPSTIAQPWHWVLNDGYTDDPGFRDCLNVKPSGGNAENVGKRLHFYNWSYIGEDRSGSNTQGTTPGMGLLYAPDVQHATVCGFGLINVDFLLAGPTAPHNPHLFAVGIGNQGFVLPPFDYRFPDPDVRREAAIWSWDENDFGADGPAYMKPNGRWSSQPENNSLPFACAIAPGEPGNPTHYTWKITDNRDVWTAGPEQCKAIGGKFWAPQTPVEGAQLASAAAGSPVWINYKASEDTIVEPVDPDIVSGNGTRQFNLELESGAPGAGLKQLKFQFTGGTGGPLSTKIAAASRNLISSIATSSMAKSLTLTLDSSILDSHDRVALPAGVYSQTFTLTEQQPDDPFTTIQRSGPHNEEFMLTITVTAPTIAVTVGSQPTGEILCVDNVAYVAPQTFTWAVGSTHTLDATKTQSPKGEKQVFAGWTNSPSAIFTYTVPASNASEVATFNPYYLLSLTIAGLGTVTATPPSSDSYYAAGSTVGLNAVPASKWRFQGFSGAVTSTADPLSVVISSPEDITATFVPRQGHNCHDDAGHHGDGGASDDNHRDHDDCDDDKHDHDHGHDKDNGGDHEHDN